MYSSFNKLFIEILLSHTAMILVHCNEIVSFSFATNIEASTFQLLTNSALIFHFKSRVNLTSKLEFHISIESIALVSEIILRLFDGLNISLIDLLISFFSIALLYSAKNSAFLSEINSLNSSGDLFSISINSTSDL
ncbi:MAG: hypothetical protein ACPHY8_03915 [Patescibacteria group bacterium]